MPPPVPGCSPAQQMGAIYGRMKVMTDVFNKAMCRAGGTLDLIQKQAIATGAYYSPCTVKTEEGYSAADSSAYTITSIKSHDTQQRPVIMRVRTAYNNTTNSNVKEPAFSASEVELADKMFSAMPLTDDGWFGKVRVDGVPIPSVDRPDLYTVGFTKCGKMKWYSNTASDDQLRRDTIMQSMGVYGVLINDGQLTGPEFRDKIPDYGVKKARVVMGQNYSERTTYVLTCGGYETTYGMLTSTCADILLGYGCDVAVELGSGGSAVALDKGKLMFTPDDAKVPELTAYWYISKKRCFVNDYQHEVGCLIQKYGQLQWELKLARDRLDVLEKEMDDAEGRLDSLEERMTAAENEIVLLQERVTHLENEVVRLEGKIDQEIQDRIDGDIALGERIDQEIADRTDADNALGARIDQEIVDRTAADDALGVRIDDETAARIAGDEALGHRIDDEEAARIAADHALDDRIDTEIAARIAADQALADRITNEVERLDGEINQIEADLATETTERKQADQVLTDAVGALRSDLTALQNTVEEYNNTLTEITTGLRTDVSNLQTLYGELQAQIAAIDNLLLSLQEAISEIKQSLVSIESRLVVIDTRLADLENCCVEARAAIAQHTEQIAALDERVTTNETNITDLQAFKDFENSGKTWLKNFTPAIIGDPSNVHGTLQCVLQAYRLGNVVNFYIYFQSNTADPFGFNAGGVNNSVSFELEVGVSDFPEWARCSGALSWSQGAMMCQHSAIDQKVVGIAALGLAPNNAALRLRLTVPTTEQGVLPVDLSGQNFLCLSCHAYYDYKNGVIPWTSG